MLAALNGDPEMPADEHPLVREKTGGARARRARPGAHHHPRAGRRRRGEHARCSRASRSRRRRRCSSLVSVSRPWVEANLKETELTHVRVGQKATVVLDTYPDVTWEAVVESISPATGAEFADPAAAERLGQLGQGGAAPAGEAAPAAACRRAAAARRHDGDGDDRHRPRAHGVVVRSARCWAAATPTRRRWRSSLWERGTPGPHHERAGGPRSRQRLTLAGVALPQSTKSLNGRKLPSSTPISAAIRAFSLAFMAAIRSRLASKS